MSILDQFLTGELQDLPNDTHGSAQGTDVPRHDVKHHSAAHHKRHHRSNAAPAHTNAHGMPHGTANANQPDTRATRNEHTPSLERTFRKNQADITTKTDATAKNNNATSKNFNAQTCLPSRQKNASDFLAGNTPGVMAFYAPEEQCTTAHNPAHPNPQPANIHANTRPDNATVEDAETVQRLVEWREEASY